MTATVVVAAVVVAAVVVAAVVVAAVVVAAVVVGAVVVAATVVVVETPQNSSTDLPASSAACTRFRHGGAAGFFGLPLSSPLM